VTAAVECIYVDFPTVSLDMPLDVYTDIVPVINFTLASGSVIRFTGLISGSDNSNVTAQIIIDGDPNNYVQQFDVTSTFVYAQYFAAGSHSIEYQALPFNYEYTLTNYGASVEILST
jgi:hypothetical protein